MKYLIYIFFCGFPFLAPKAASADEWHIYSSCNDVYALAQDGDYLW